MTTADNIARLDTAMADHGQPTQINFADLHKEVSARREQVLARMAVVRVAKVKNAEQRTALDEHDAALVGEIGNLEKMADAMLSEMHAFERLMQGQ